MAQDNSITKIDLTALRRQRILIDLGDGNENNILEINTSDFGVLNRLSDGYSRLVELDNKFQNLRFENTEIEDTDSGDVAQSKLKSVSDQLKEIDTEMREIIDYIFDTNACEVCAPWGSMYDPISGKMRYEYVIEALITLYTDSISSEMTKVANRMKTHTAKYTKKR